MNNKIVQKFLEDLQSEGKSINTIDSYNIDLRGLFKYLGNKEIQDITTRDLKDYLNKLFQEGKSDSTRARNLATIKSFFKYLKKGKIVENNISEDLGVIKIEKKQPIYLTLEEAKQFMKVVQDKKNIRDYCIMTIFLHCGLRVSELCALNLEDINADTLLIHGKGNKQRIIQLDDITVNTLNEYLAYRKTIKKIRKVDSKKALFLTRFQIRVTKASIEILVKKYIKKTGIEKNITPHKLRHSLASLLYKNGVGILEIKELLGHSNVKTTQIYTHLGNDQMKNAVEMNPLNR